MQELTKAKDHGNLLFKEKKYGEALSHFEQIISKIQSSQNKQYLSNQTQIGKLYVVVLINSALTCINSKGVQNYKKALEFCNKAIAVDPKNVKALYRRGLAQKSLAEAIEVQNGSQAQGLLELYEKAKKDFEDVGVLQKNNDLAIKYLKTTIKDIYRITVARGEEVDFSSQKTEQKLKKSNPYQIPEGQKKKKRNNDMNKIMKDYKVEEVTNLVQDKIRKQYLVDELPELRSDLQKAIRTIQKSEDVFLKFAYRMSSQYLQKIKPTFDMLGILVNIILKRGEGIEAANVLKACQEQTSFKLLWKSFITKQKKQFKEKWVSLELPQNALD